MISGSIYVAANCIISFFFMIERVSMSSCSFQHLFPGFLIVDILMGVSYLIAILICISLIISDVWASSHVFIGHLYVFFGEISSQVLCTFFNGVVVLLLGNIFFFLYNSLVLRF